MGDEAFARALESHRERLWGLAYRMLADPGEAEDLVQDTYARALERRPDLRSPSDGRADLGPWLTTVLTRMSIDRLRRRKARAYDGPWLPVPVLDLPELQVEASRDADPEFTLGARESASLAFLTALEALEPKPRAVLLLHGVFGYTAAELAAALETSAGNVRVILHRARKHLEAWRETSRDVRPLDPAGMSDLLVRFADAVARGDVDALERLFAEDVEIVNDANGHFHAARQVLRGRSKAARFVLGILRKGGMPGGQGVVELNGEPVMWASRHSEDPKLAPRWLNMIRVREGRIVSLYSWLAPEKLPEIAWT